MSTRAASRAISIRLALLGLLYYSCIFLIKASMFACSWSRQPSFLGLSYKTLLALAQTFGYAAGKVPSLLYSPKLPPQRLRGALVAVVLIAGGNVLLSCITPASMSLFLVFHACVWLAPTWSLLQRFFEGRRDTEAIVALVSFFTLGAAAYAKALPSTSPPSPASASRGRCCVCDHRHGRWRHGRVWRRRAATSFCGRRREARAAEADGQLFC